MKIKLLTVYTVLITLLCAGPASAVLISVGTFDATNSPFVVPIRVTDAFQLSSWQFDVTFDPNVIQVDELCDRLAGNQFCDPIFGPVTEGDFFSSAAQFPPFFGPGFILNSSGLLDDVNGAWQDPPPGPSGDGILAYVQFIRVGDGEPNINITDASTTSVPEPMSLLLLAGGLTFLGARRRLGKSEQR